MYAVTSAMFIRIIAESTVINIEHKKILKLCSILQKSKLKNHQVY